MSSQQGPYETGQFSKFNICKLQLLYLGWNHESADYAMRKNLSAITSNAYCIPALYTLVYVIHCNVPIGGLLQKEDIRWSRNFYYRIDVVEVIDKRVRMDNFPNKLEIGHNGH